MLVVWDDEDASTDPFFQAAVCLGAALVTRSRAVGDAGDIAALRDVDARIEAELTRLEKMEKCNEGIRRNSDGISEEIRKSRKALDVLLRKAQDTLRALNVELPDEAAEKQSPIELPSLEVASEPEAATSSDGRAA